MTVKKDDVLSVTYLVKLGRVVDVNFERDARVLALLARAALEHALIPLCQASSDSRSNIGYEAFVIHTDDFQVKTAGILRV